MNFFLLIYAMCFWCCLNMSFHIANAKWVACHLVRWHWKPTRRKRGWRSKLKSIIEGIIPNLNNSIRGEFMKRKETNGKWIDEYFVKAKMTTHLGSSRERNKVITNWVLVKWIKSPNGFHTKGIPNRDPFSSVCPNETLKHRMPNGVWRMKTPKRAHW